VTDKKNRKSNDPDWDYIHHVWFC